MKTVTVGKEIEAVPSVIAGRRREHIFYIGMGVVIAATIFVGFAPSYFLKPYYNTPYYSTQPLTPLLHLHGIVFTAWFLLYLTQTILIAAHRTTIHRRLGILGAVLAVLMVVLGTATGILMTRRFLPLPDAMPIGLPPLTALAMLLGEMVAFSSLVSAGIYFRRRPDVHKRLMLLATISISVAAIGRLPFAFIQEVGPLAFFGLTDLFVVALLIYDLISLGRVHRATAWGGLLLVASQTLHWLIGGTEVWIQFATWLIQ
jgi:hypothetical protein